MFFRGCRLMEMYRPPGGSTRSTSVQSLSRSRDRPKPPPRSGGERISMLSIKVFSITTSYAPSGTSSVIEVPSRTHHFTPAPVMAVAPMSSCPVAVR